MPGLGSVVDTESDQSSGNRNIGASPEDSREEERQRTGLFRWDDPENLMPSWSVPPGLMVPGPRQPEPDAQPPGPDAPASRPAQPRRPSLMPKSQPPATVPGLASHPPPDGSCAPHRRRTPARRVPLPRNPRVTSLLSRSRRPLPAPVPRASGTKLPRNQSPPPQPRPPASGPAPSPGRAPARARARARGQPERRCQPERQRRTLTYPRAGRILVLPADPEACAPAPRPDSGTLRPRGRPGLPAHPFRPAGPGGREHR